MSVDSESLNEMKVACGTIIFPNKEKKPKVKVKTLKIR